MPRECALDEGREYGRRARARAVRDAESEDGVFEAVELAVRAAEHLACELRRRIEMRWERKRRVLVERFGAARIAVDPDRTCVNDMCHVLRARGIEYQRCAARVHGAARAGSKQRVAVADVPDDHVHLARIVVWRGHEVEDSRLVSGGAKAVDHMRSDEAGSACDENFHAPFLAATSSVELGR